MQAPADGHAERAGDVGRVDRGGRERRRDLRLRDAVRADGQADERNLRRERARAVRRLAVSTARALADTTLTERRSASIASGC